MGQVNVVVNRYVYGMDPQAALDFPRLFPRGDSVLTESTVPASTLASLAAKGHRLDIRDVRGVGSVKAILIDPRTGVLMGGVSPTGDSYVMAW